MIRFAAISVLGLLLVSGCSTYSLEELRHTTPKGSKFQNALAKLYMDFADSEEKDYDWKNSWHFADKGLLAVYGKDTTPEELENWNLPKDKLAQFEKSRADLIAVLTPEMLEKKPEIAARAQFYFDCWVEQQEENWQKDDIAACRDGFVLSLAKLDISDENLPKKSYKKAPKKIAKKTVKAAKESVAKETIIEKKQNVSIAPTTTSFVVFFESGKTNITAIADSTIGEIIKALFAQENYSVVIIDKSSNRKDNLELSLERIQAVKTRLVEASIKESSIVTGSEKQSSNKINYKVEIFLND